MKTPNLSGRNKQLLTVAGIALGGFVLYSIFNKAAAQTPAGGSSGSGSLPLGTGPGYGGGSVAYTPSALDLSVPGVSFAPSTIQPGVLTSTLTAVPAVTSAQVAQANSFWSTLTPTTPPSSGYITFPSGTQVAATLMGGGNTAQDANGNLYVQWAGQVYQLPTTPDSSGNWVAIPAG